MHQWRLIVTFTFLLLKLNTLSELQYCFQWRFFTLSRQNNSLWLVRKRVLSVLYDRYLRQFFRLPYNWQTAGMLITPSFCFAWLRSLWIRQNSLEVSNIEPRTDVFSFIYSHSTDTSFDANWPYLSDYLWYLLIAYRSSI